MVTDTDMGMVMGMVIMKMKKTSRSPASDSLKKMDQIRVYTSEPSIRKPGVLIGEMWRDLIRSRELAWRLAVRDISSMYRQSILGMLWALIVPLANTLTWIFLRSTGIVSMGETPIPYAVYVFTGTMLWAIFMESMQAPLQKALAGKAILGKINFPREALILSGIYQVGFNACIKIFLMLIGMIALGYYSINWRILLFPIGIISMITAGTSVGLLLTPMGMLYTDIGKGLSIAMQFLMYATPVVFPMPKEGWIKVFISYNPITPLLMTARDWLTGSPANFIYGFVWVNLAFITILFFAWIIYRAAMPILIERMSS
jgi:homopolymeric O-antigen transport system permease protein